MRLKSMVWLVSLTLITLLGGCGGGGGGGDDLVGSLSLDATSTDLTGGNYQVDAIAKYTHPTRDPLGTEIEFTFTAFSNGIVIGTSSQTKKVGSSGEVGLSSAPIKQISTPIFVDVVAKTGDLSQFKRVTIPAIQGLSVTPTAVAFENTDQIGTTKTLTISGGVSQYSASSNDSNIGVSVTGSVVTLTLVNRTLAAGTDTASITITDSDQPASTVTANVSF